MTECLKHHFPEGYHPDRRCEYCQVKYGYYHQFERASKEQNKPELHIDCKPHTHKEKVTK